MPEREKVLLNCFRLLPPEDQSAVLSHVRTAYAAENTATMMPARVSAGDSGGGKEVKRGKRRGAGYGDMIE